MHIKFGGAKRKGLSRLLAIVAVAALAGGLAACSDTGGDGGGDAASTGLSGEPIKTVSIAAVDYNGPTYEAYHVTAKAYEHFINENGGIAGRPLEAIVCDDKGDPTETARCAREAVEAGAIADVGSFTYNASVTLPIYEAADVAVFGNCCNMAADEYTSPVTFQTGNNPVNNPGHFMRAITDGCDAIGALVLDLPGITEGVIETYENVIEAYDYQGEVTYVRVPLTTQDYTSQVTQATAGTDCLSLFLSESNIAAMMAPFAQEGGEQTLYGAQGNLNHVATKGYEDLPGVKNAVIAGPYLPIENPVYDDFRASLEAIDAPDNLDYSSLAGLGAWSAFVAFTDIVEGIEGDITPTSFLEAANGATVDIEMFPATDFGTTWDAFDGRYARAFNRHITYLDLDGNSMMENGETWIDMSDIVQGIPQG